MILNKGAPRNPTPPPAKSPGLGPCGGRARLAQLEQEQRTKNPSLRPDPPASSYSKSRPPTSQSPHL